MLAIARNKKIKKAMTFYKMNFGLKEPYEILLDGNFVFAGQDMKIHIKDQMTKLLGVNHMKITKCCLKELDGMPGQIKEARESSKKWTQMRNCTHPQCSSFDCILKTLEEGFKGIVCTQDFKLRSIIRKKFPGIPVFYIREAIRIEEPSKSLKNKINSEFTEKYAAGHRE